MIWTNNIPNKGKRILMVAPDVVIDRRILIEAETLVDEGYEVYLLAGWDANQSELFEIQGRIRIERIKYEGLDHRLNLVYRFQFKIIEILNKISLLTNRFWGKLSSVGNNIINSSSCKFVSLLNRFSAVCQKIFGKSTRYTARIFIINSLTRCFLRITMISITLLAKFFNLSHSIIAKIYQFPINLFLKINNYSINLTARFINFCVNKTVRIYPFLVGLTAYEDSFFRRAVFYQPDIVHVHDLPMLRIGVKIKKKLGIPLIYDMHEFYPEQPRLTFKQQTYLRHLEKKYIGYADQVITVNFMLGEVIKKRYSLQKINVIQNAIMYGPEYNPNCSYNRFREDYPHLKNKLLLLYQGWVATGRNLENSIRAMALVKNKQWVLLIMGYGDYTVELQKLVSELGIDDSVEFVPAKSQDILLTYTASADLGLIPYPTDKDLNTHFVSPNKLYEFIAVGLPFISNRLPYIQYVIEQNGFGLVADLNSIESFAKEIDSVDMEQLQKLHNNVKSNGWKYSWDEEKKNLLSLYQAI